MSSSKGQRKSNTKHSIGNGSNGTISPTPSQTKDDNIENENGTTSTEEYDALDATDAAEKFCWRRFLMANPEHDIKPAPVWAFPHAPLSKIWDQIEIDNVKVEYKLGTVKGRLAIYGNVFWIGSITKYFGYLVKVDAAGYPPNFEGDLPTRWLNYITDCYKIGHCGNIEEATLIPPLDIMQNEKDWRNKVVKEITGSYTIHPRVEDLLSEDKLKILPVGGIVEALDNQCISRMKPGRVVKSVGGRVQIRYWDAKEGSETNSDTFWCSLTSSLVLPRGWCKTVGHDINAPPNYDPKIVPAKLVGKENPGIDIKVGMKLEAVDPVNPGVISVATVTKVLEFGFMMISIDGPTEEMANGDSGAKKTENGENQENGNSDPNNDFYCYHVTSQLIFPCGFCEQWGITLCPPKGYSEKTFNWNDYLAETGSKALEIPKTEYTHGFEVGMKMEAADLVEPSLICISTVVDVKGRLLRVHFDGWPDEYDQWMDCNSPDIYPVGWCDIHSYALQAPKGDEFYKIYKRPDPHINIRRTFEDSDEYRPKTASRRRGRPPKTPSPATVLPEPTKRPNNKAKEAVKRPAKRKASEPLAEPLVDRPEADHSKLKAEAIKLGQKPKVQVKAALQELRASLGKTKPKGQIPDLPPAMPKESKV